MEKMRAVLFDFDGVIVDSTPIHLAGWANAFEAMFQAPLDPTTLLSLVGRSTAAIGTILAEKSGYPAARGDLIKRKSRYVFDHLETIPLITGARDFVHALAKRGVPHGVVSNAPRDFIAATLERHELRMPFYLGLEDCQRPKPDAEPYMKGALRMGFKFHEHKSIYVFEDSTHGIEAAVAAHMTPIGICSQHPSEPLERAGATRCFADLLPASSLLNS
jgi:beta-phosphoglucomutase